MGLIDDIKNIQPLSNKVLTYKDIEKMIKSIPFSGKGNKTIKKYRNNIK